MASLALLAVALFLQLSFLSDVSEAFKNPIVLEGLLLGTVSLAAYARAHGLRHSWGALALLPVGGILLGVLAVTFVSWGQRH
jgi:hypothetical protein